MSANAQPILYAMPYSPWSEKARWALDHHQVVYAERLYTPMLSEPALRIRLRRLRGPVSVPVLFAGGEAYTESFDIAQFAERIGTGAPLFRRGLEAEIDRWERVSDRVMRAGRAAATIRMIEDPEARREALPGIVPRPLRRPFDQAATVAVRYLQRKYGFADDPAHHRAEMRAGMLELRGALADGRSHILGELTYADVAMAASLLFVQPVDDRYIEFGPATRRAWTDLDLASEFTDLIEWRDQLYAHARRRPVA